jgi:phosphoglycolate phosphatase
MRHRPAPSPSVIGPHDVTHVVWDWNGTLLDDAWLCVEVMNGLLARYGLPPMSPDRYATVFRFPVRAYYADLGFDLDAVPFEKVGTEFIEGYAAGEDRCGLQDGAREALGALKDLGLTQSVLSASEARRLAGQAARLGVHGHFEALVGLDDHYAGGKIGVGARWLEGAPVHPETVLLVGDTDHDAEVARALGLRCVLVPSGHQAPERLAATGAPILPSLRDLLDVLGRAA